MLLVTGKLVGALGALFKAVGFLAGAGGIPRLIGVLRTLSLMKLGVIGAIIAIGAAMIYGINAAHDWVFELTHGKKALKDLQALAAQGLNDKVANEIIEMGVSLEDWSRLVDAAEGDTDAAFKAIADHAGDVGGAMADLVRQTEDEGASWDRAMLGYAKGAQDAKTAIVDSAEEIPPAYAAVLADGRLQVEQAAQDGIEDPIKKAMEKAVEEAGKAAQDALNRIESIFAKGPDQLRDELKALREALKNPYTELERTADLNVYLATKAIIDGLKSGDPLIEKAAFSQVNSWLEQWQDLTGGAYDAGRGVNPAFTDGAGSNLDEAIRYLQQNNIIPIVDLYQLADVLDAAGYDALAAYARGQARADLDRGIAVRTGIVRDIKSDARHLPVGGGLQHGPDLRAGPRLLLGLVDQAEGGADPARGPGLPRVQRQPAVYPFAGGRRGGRALVDHGPDRSYPAGDRGRTRLDRGSPGRLGPGRLPGRRPRAGYPVPVRCNLRRRRAGREQLLQPRVYRPEGQGGGRGYLRGAPAYGEVAMSVLVYRSVELRDLSVRRCYGSLISGWRDGVVTKGTNAEVAQAAGQDDLPRLDRYRQLELVVPVLGTSESNWNTVMAELEAIFDPALAAGTLTVHSPYMGLASGSRAISAYVDSARHVDQLHMLVSTWQVVLIAPAVDWS